MGNKGVFNKGKMKEEKDEVKEDKKWFLKAGEKIKQVKGDSAAHDKTEAPPGIMVGKGPKFQ